ncbi:UNKNOWN [Stylonychia lemnae]|uniref:Uncharacterized protein n=1 Tax=Stylonychia lemnae TaxID=5949 RepID=A0A078ANV7_STYLE|nr:UNKNOWN [Stylonychia lemnae]|eukprot:CDW83839.1 UNKNOWN [Stylonychia lemnae]
MNYQYDSTTNLNTSYQATTSNFALEQYQQPGSIIASTFQQYSTTGQGISSEYPQTYNQQAIYQIGNSTVAALGANYSLGSQVMSINYELGYQNTSVGDQSLVNSKELQGEIIQINTLQQPSNSAQQETNQLTEKQKRALRKQRFNLSKDQININMTTIDAQGLLAEEREKRLLRAQKFGIDDKETEKQK